MDVPRYMWLILVQGIANPVSSFDPRNSSSSQHSYTTPSHINLMHGGFPSLVPRAPVDQGSVILAACYLQISRGQSFLEACTNGYCCLLQRPCTGSVGFLGFPEQRHSCGMLRLYLHFISSCITESVVVHSYHRADSGNKQVMVHDFAMRKQTYVPTCDVLGRRRVCVWSSTRSSRCSSLRTGWLSE